jgi:hypothetical protein
MLMAGVVAGERHMWFAGCRLRLVPLLLGLGLCPAAAAETVHTWVDDQGVRHFSQYPPADPDQPSRILELEPLSTAPEADDRLQSIRDVTRDLELSRLQREEQRARGTPPDYAEPPAVEPDYVLPYPYFAPYPPAYPPYRPRPHPHERPEGNKPGKPSRPGGRVLTPEDQSPP